MTEPTATSAENTGVPDAVPTTTAEDEKVETENNTGRMGTTMNMDAQIRPELKEKIQAWILSFYHLDPRYKILTFFNLVASEGADNVTDDQIEEPDSESDVLNTARKKTKASNPTSSAPNNARENYKINAHLMSRPSARNIRPSTLSLLSRIFNATSILTVWRPCSNDAMRKMMEGTGVGKGLDIKGKSAKKGILSAYVPFMQIFENDQKNEIQPITVGAEMRIYYQDEKLRDHVHSVLQKFLEKGPPKKKKKKKTVKANKVEAIDVVEEKSAGTEELTGEVLKEGDPEDLARSSSATNDDDSGDEEEEESDSEHSDRVPDHKNPTSARYVETKLKKLKKFAKKGFYGIECTQRLFWYATIDDADISRKGTGTETGRPSLPGFQDGNLKTLKVAQSQMPKPVPMPVVLQYKTLDEVQKESKNDDDNSLDGALDPRFLVMAYEEQGTIKPVVSDFDGFLLGWRREALWFGCNLPRYQEMLAMWCVERIEEILDKQKENPDNTDTWTQRWLDVLKKAAAEGFHIETPEYGFGDPKSTSIMEHAAHKLKSTGAVRHGSECFNYGFPQEIDDMFLLISDTLKPVPWKYVNVKDLQAILSEKIAEGFMFPLNPKWILCDPGWKKLYDDLMASDALYADLSKDVWYPPYSGIREKIEDIYKRYPNGFQRSANLAKGNKGKGLEKNALGRRQSATNILRDTLDEGLGSELTGNAFADLAILEFDDFVGRTSAMPGRGLGVDSEMGRNILKARQSLTIEEFDDDYSDSDPPPKNAENSNAITNSLTTSVGSGGNRKGGGITWSKAPRSANRRPSNVSHASSVASSVGSVGTNHNNVTSNKTKRDIPKAPGDVTPKSIRKLKILKGLKSKRKVNRDHRRAKSMEANVESSEHDGTEASMVDKQSSLEGSSHHRRTESEPVHPDEHSKNRGTANPKTKKTTNSKDKNLFNKWFGKK